MKVKFTIACFALLLSFSAQSQITLSSTDMPFATWTNPVAKDTPVTTINYGNKGANQVYDFSALTVTKRDTAVYLALTNTQHTQFPNATIAVTPDHGSTFIFGKISASTYDAEGLQGQLAGNTTYANFSPVEDIYHFPTQYGGAFSGSWGFQNTLPGSAVGQPVYEVRITYTDNFTDTIDGWGKTITPIGAYKSLREKRNDHTETILEYQLFNGSGWSQLSDNLESTVEYNYLAKETKGALVSFDYDSAGDLLDAKYSLVPPAAPVAHFNYTSGGGGLINFTDSTDGYPTTYSWNFGDGSGTSSAQNPNHTFTANDTYYVCETVTNAGGSDTYCDSVTISGLFLPVSSYQPGSVHIYPNPVSDYLTIDMRENNDEAINDYASIEIYNTIGERVITLPGKNQLKLINVPVAGLPSGMYLASVIDANGARRVLGKFVK